MKSNYKPIGDYIQRVDERNTDLNIDNLQGIRINKEFMPSVANVIGTDLSKYKVVRKHQFAYNPMHVGRDKVLPISVLLNDAPIIVSPAYVVFEIIDHAQLLPEYLMMWCRRPEFDRNAWFMTDSSVRGGFSWNDFCDMRLPVPDLAAQTAIVAEYAAVVNRIRLNEHLNRKLEETAQAIYTQWFVEFDFPDDQGNPYKSSGGDMEYNEELDQEIPKGWEVQTINSFCEITSSKRIFQSEYTEHGIPFYRGKEIILKKQGKPLQDVIYISKERYTEIVENFGKPQAGDILLTAVGTLGVSYLVQNEDFYFKDGNVIWFKHFWNQAIKQYLYDFMQCSKFKELIDEITIGSTQNAITIETIGRRYIVVPPVEILNKYRKLSFALIQSGNLKKQSNYKLFGFKNILLSKMTLSEN